MRVAHIISMPAHGGAEHYVKNLAVAMKRGGHEVSIWFLSDAPDRDRKREYQKQLLAFLQGQGVDCEVLDGRGWRQLPGAILRVRRLVKSKRIALIHAHLFQGILVSALGSRPIVYTRHGMRLRLHPKIYRWMFDRVVHAYVAISATQNALLRAVVRRPVALIPNGVDLSAFTPKRPRGSIGIEVVRLVSVGRLVGEKNFAGLLRSLASMQSRHWALSLAGDGPERSELEALAGELGLDSRVNFLGSVTDVPGLLAKSDVFVMSSTSEGMPIALLEATAAGLPVVVTDVGGCAEVVEQVGHGIVVPTGSESAYASALSQLIDNVELRKSFAENAVSGAAHYSIERCAEQHLALYRELIEADGASAGPQGMV